MSMSTTVQVTENGRKYSLRSYWHEWQARKYDLRGFSFSFRLSAVTFDVKWSLAIQSFGNILSMYDVLPVRRSLCTDEMFENH